MLVQWSVRRLLLVFILGRLACAQCFDLRVARIYDPVGRFQEHWDHPLWNSKPGTENFRLDEPTWGGALQFALFAIGVVKKSSSGWISYRSTRTPEIWCDPAPERAGQICYMVPYQVAPPSAIWRMKADSDVESWALDKSGLVTYHRTRRGESRVVESRSNQFRLPNAATDKGTEDVAAALNLASGNYHVEDKVYMANAHLRRIPGGTQLWRTETFNGRVEAPPVPCPLTTQKIVLSTNGEPEEIPMPAFASCVVKVKKYSGSGLSAIPTAWEFKENPEKRSSWEGCVLVFETPKLSSVEEERSNKINHN